MTLTIQPTGKNESKIQLLFKKLSQISLMKIKKKILPKKI